MNEINEECVTVAEDECHTELAEVCEDASVEVPCKPVCRNVDEEVCADTVEQVRF